MLVSIFTNVKNANKFLNQNKATAVYIAVMEELFVHQFSKTIKVAEGLNTKKPNTLHTGLTKVTAQWFVMTVVRKLVCISNQHLW